MRLSLVITLISRVTFSKTGKMVYWHGKRLQRSPVRGGCSNHYDLATGELYWVSGPKRNGEDRYPWGIVKVQIDEDVREEYWTAIRREPERLCLSRSEEVV